MKSSIKCNFINLCFGDISDFTPMSSVEKGTLSNSYFNNLNISK